LWAIHEYGAAGLGWVSEGKTLAEGVKVLHPVRGDAVLKVIKESQGMMVAVREEDILPGRDRLAKLGFYVEPTSAIVWDGLKQIIATLPDPIVIILTGSGLKYVDMSISSV
jgi:threonine synthase